MSRINTNVQSILAQRVLGQNNQGLAGSLERLSTGLRINRGKDDPAGLIASQNLRAEKSALGAAIKNAERADQVANIAEGGLNEVSGLLTELQGLLTTTANDAGLSTEEKAANQLQIDSILQTIDRVAASTSFQGKKLLNGNLNYTTTGIDAEVSNFKVNGAKLGFGETRDVDVLVTQSAQVGGLAMQFSGTALDLTNADSTFTIEVAGNEGSRELSFSSGTTLATIASTINSFTDVTGVIATASGNDIKLVSSEYGSDQFVSLKVIDDGGAAGAGVDQLAAADTNALAGSPVAFNTLGNGTTDFGQDVRATINGIAATTKGTNVAINTDFLDVSIDLSDTGATTLGVVNAFTIEGGGGDFQLGGRVDIAGKVSLGISNVAVREIGLVEDGGNSYSLADIGSGKALNVEDGDLSVAQDAVDRAIKDVNSLRGRLGAFQQNTVGATIRSLGVSFENTTAAESAIRDTDFAAETAALTRNQILSQSATQILTIANSQPQNALSLLG
ncbi:MAG: flagellin [Phycisphaerales bacterium JB050]